MATLRLILNVSTALLVAMVTRACSGNINQLVAGGPDCIYIINAPRIPGGCCPTLREAAQHVIDSTDGETGDCLLAYYPLDGDPSDQSGNDRNGVDVGTASYGTSDVVCGASRFFDGDSKITVAAFENFDLGDEFSVSVWFKRTGQFGNYQGIVNNGYHSTGSWEIRMGGESGGTMLGGGVVTSDSPATWDYVHLSASTNQWHHVVMTYDGSYLAYYLDGVPQSGDDDCCSGPILTRNNVVTIGQAGVGKSNEHFYGYIDEMKLFSKALTPAEVNQLHQNPCGSNPIAYYPLDGDPSDQSGNDRNGVDVGKASYGTSDVVCGASRFFDGDSKITVAAFENFDWGDEFSVSVWFKRTGQFGNYQGIVNNGYHSTGSWEIGMGRESGGTMLGGGVVTSGSPTTWDYVHLSASTNQWHHVVMTYDGSYLAYYLDGVPQSGDDDCCSGPIITRNNVVTIGQAGVGMSNEYFHGYIDEVKLFAKALTPTEVALLSQNPC